MKTKSFYKIVLIMCVLIFNLSQKVNGANFDPNTALPSVNFPQVHLDGINQSIAGGGSSLKIRVNVSSLVGESWYINVKGTRFTQVGGEGIILPLGSILLKKPILNSASKGCNNPKIYDEEYWVIDSGEEIKRFEGSFLLGLISNSYCSFNFVQDPFSLNIYAGKKMISSGNTATYKSVITWTLISAGL